MASAWFQVRLRAAAVFAGSLGKPNCRWADNEPEEIEVRRLTRTCARCKPMFSKTETGFAFGESGQHGAFRSDLGYRTRPHSLFILSSPLTTLHHPSSHNSHVAFSRSQGNLAGRK